MIHLPVYRHVRRFALSLVSLILLVNQFFIKGYRRSLNGKLFPYAMGDCGRVIDCQRQFCDCEQQLLIILHAIFAFIINHMFLHC